MFLFRFEGRSDPESREVSREHAVRASISCIPSLPKHRHNLLVTGPLRARTSCARERQYFLHSFAAEARSQSASDRSATNVRPTLRSIFALSIYHARSRNFAGSVSISEVARVMRPTQFLQYDQQQQAEAGKAGLRGRDVRQQSESPSERCERQRLHRCADQKR